MRINEVKNLYENKSRAEQLWNKILDTAKQFIEYNKPFYNSNTPPGSWAVCLHVDDKQDSSLENDFIQLMKDKKIVNPGDEEQLCFTIFFKDVLEGLGIKDIEKYEHLEHDIVFSVAHAINTTGEMKVSPWRMGNHYMHESVERNNDKSSQHIFDQARREAHRVSVIRGDDTDEDICEPGEWLAIFRIGNVFGEERQRTIDFIKFLENEKKIGGYTNMLDDDAYIVVFRETVDSLRNYFYDTECDVIQKAGIQAFVKTLKEFGINAMAEAA